MGGSFRLTTQKNTFGYPEEEPGHLRPELSSIPYKAGGGGLLWKIPVTECDIVTLQLSGVHSVMQTAMLGLSFT